MFHQKYAIATQIWRRKFDLKKIENKKKNPNDITIFYLSDVAGKNLHWACLVTWIALFLKWDKITTSKGSSFD